VLFNLNSKTKRIIFKQESLSSVLPLTYTGITTLLFLSSYIAKCLGHFEFKTLLSSSSAFCKGQKISSVPGHPTDCTYRVGTSKSFWDQEFLFSAKFLFQAAMQGVGFQQVPPRSLSKRLVLSTTLWQHTKMSTTLKSPKGLNRVQGRAAEQLTLRPVHPINESSDHHGSAGKPQDKPS
jgi:hypothetical protein